MKKYSILFALISVLFILTACSSGETKEQANTKQLIIPKIEHYEHLYVMGLNEEGIASEETKLTNSDVATVKDVLGLVNRLVVKKPKFEKDIESVKQLDEQGSYILAFGDTKDFRGETYTIYMMKNGDFYYQDTLGSEDMVYVTVEQHIDILKEVKEKLAIDF